VSAAPVLSPRSISTPEILSAPHLPSRHAPNAISHLKERSMKTLCAALAVTCMFLAGCNTMAGAGKDIQTGGQKLENSADNAKQKM
jgi:entericidin B